ncbi:hypothetical protein BGZ73_007078 [Actinomortierella ambigua]|nr:hypothetical protein BGZ73_007078 [Actinomortierella ambigua]
MGDSLPQYHFPCLAPDSTASNAIFLAGVDNTSTLQIHRVNLANVINPLLTPLLQQTNRTLWAANKPLTCNVFDADRFRFGGGAPMVLTQVSGESTGTTEKGAPLTMAVVTNHGTLVWTHAAAGPWRVANGLYSNTGASNKYLWYTGFSSVTEGDGAKSGWFATLTTTPLLSVGTYAATSQLPATGFLSVFDENGGGFTYTVNSGVAIDNTTNIQSLSNPTKIKMNGIKLTKDAFPVAMGTKGYIVDKASSGATILYSIQPGSTENPELQRVSVIGQVPPFLRKRASTSLGTQLVFYGGIVGGSLTGLVVLAFGLFLAIRYRRRRRFHFGQQVESALHEFEAVKEGQPISNRSNNGNAAV